VQKPVLEHAAPKANQNQGLDSRLADEATALMQKANEFSPSDVARGPCPIIYVMSNEEKSKQLGQLMLDKKASEMTLAELQLRAKNIGKQFESIGSSLSRDPASLVFPHESVDTRFRDIKHLSDGTIASADEVRALTNAIRAEQIKLWAHERDLKTLGF
jgi:hypothetical protein